MVVQEPGQVLTQTFVALAFVAESDGPFEQRFLKFLWQIAPKVYGGRPKHKKAALGRPVARGVIR
jgi:hypothetical protein